MISSINFLFFFKVLKYTKLIASDCYNWKFAIWLTCDWSISIKMQSHYYLKFLFCFFLFQNILAEDVISISSTPSNSSNLLPGILDSNATNLNSTLFNSTLLNNTAPVLYNCTGGLNNATDLSKCTPINITLSYECVKVDYDFLIYSVTWQPKQCYARNCDRPYEVPRW